MPASHSIRAERPADAAAIARIHTEAFDGSEEAELVAALRDVADPYLSLVAVVDGAPVGHILFTPVTILGDTDSSTALGLGPMAVLPEHQRAGIGSALVRAGLDACREVSHHVVFVLGHPEYYPRFGFRPAPPLGLRFRSPEFDPAFMVIELSPGALGGRSGMVEYLPPFET